MRSEHSNFISDRPITEDTLIEKAIFAFFSHTDEYAKAVETGGNLVQKFRERLVTTSNQTYKSIKLREYNLDRHQWIDAEENGDLIPEKFNGIAKQLRSEKPAYITKKAGKFCHNFAAICIVANDVLGCHFGHDSISGKQIRSLVDLDNDKSISREQMATFGAIAKELRNYEAQTNPNWAITYESNRPIIKTDKGKYFLPSSQVRAVAEFATGRYLVHRRSFNRDGSKFIRDYLNVRRHSSGSVFSWYVYNFDAGKIRIFNGVVFYLRNSICLQGIDDEPYPRMRCALVPTKDWEQHKLNNPEYPLFCGEILSAHSYSGEIKAVSGTIALTAEREGDLSEFEFKQKARPMEDHEVSDEIRAIIE